MISKDVVILTKAEFAEIKRKEFLRGVARGRFEEGYERSNSQPPGKVGHLGATENTGAASADAAVRSAN
jgi:hypothetical protein